MNTHCNIGALAVVAALTLALALTADDYGVMTARTLGISFGD